MLEGNITSRENVVYTYHGKSNHRLSASRWSPVAVLAILLAAAILLTSQQGDDQNALEEFDSSHQEALYRLHKKFADSENLGTFSMLDSWRRRPSGVSYWAKQREARESQKLSSEMEENQESSGTNGVGTPPLTGDQAILARSFQRLNGGGTSFKEMREKYLAQNGISGGSRQAPVSEDREQPLVSPPQGVSVSSGSFSAASPNLPRYGAIFGTESGQQAEAQAPVAPAGYAQEDVVGYQPAGSSSAQSFAAAPESNPWGQQLRSVDAQPAWTQEQPQLAYAQPSAIEPARYMQNSYAAAPAAAGAFPQPAPPRYAAMFAPAPTDTPAQAAPGWESLSAPAEPVAYTAGDEPYAAPAELPAPPRAAYRAAPEAAPAGPRSTALRGEYPEPEVRYPGAGYGTEAVRYPGAGYGAAPVRFPGARWYRSPVEDGYEESDGGAALERDAYGDPVPLSYPDQIPAGPAGVLTPADRLRAARMAAARVRQSQSHLQKEWGELMRRPPPVTASTRPDIIDPDDYATTSADFDRKRKEMLAFKAALMAFKSDPEFNPMIVMLAHTLVRYGVPPPESDDIHVWQQWYREADDKFKLLQAQVEKMASGRWRNEETSWERHHLRRPDAYKTATRAEVREPDDSFAGRQDVAAAGRAAAPAAAEWGGNRTVSEGGGAGNGTASGEAALEAEVADLARRLGDVEERLSAERAAGAPAPAAAKQAGRPGASILAAGRPSAAPAPAGGVALPPPPKAVVKWLADAFLNAERAATKSPAAPERAGGAPAARSALAAAAAPAAGARAGGGGPLRAVACEAGECHPAHRGPPVAVRAAAAPPAVHVPPVAETPLMQTGPVPGREDMLKKGADMLKLEDKALPAAKHGSAPAGGRAAKDAELRRLAAKVIRAGTMPSPSPPARAAAAPAQQPAAAPAAAGGVGGRPGASKYNKVFVGGRSMYVPAYDHTKTAGDGWGWLWGR